MPPSIITSQDQGAFVSLGIIVVAFAILFIPALIIWAVLHVNRPQGADQDDEDEAQAEYLDEWCAEHRDPTHTPCDYVIPAKRPVP